MEWNAAWPLAFAEQTRHDSPALIFSFAAHWAPRDLLLRASLQHGRHIG
jgi:hypothetical protein